LAVYLPKALRSGSAKNPPSYRETLAGGPTIRQIYPSKQSNTEIVDNIKYKMHWGGGHLLLGDGGREYGIDTQENGVFFFFSGNVRPQSGAL
jgi:hypothetical protein